MRRRDQRGTALLSVLLLTATLAVLAVAMTDLMTRSLAKAAAGEARDQAFWVMAGIETAALQVLEQQEAAVDLPGSPLFAQPVVLRVDGGTATIRFREATNCFNVNELVAKGDEGVLVPDAAAIQRFALFVRELGGSQTAGEQLAARIADFIDTDTDPEAGGFEDFDYRAHEVPYRTPGRLLASVTELRAVAGFSRDVYRLLAPWLCALPTDETQRLNVNTLTPRDIPLLVGFSGGAMTPYAAQAVVEQRPAGGYQTVEDFLGQPLFEGADLPPDLNAQLTVTSEVLRMEIVLETGIGRLRQETLVSRAGGSPRVIDRTIGERLP